MNPIRQTSRLAALAIIAVAVFGCSSELTNSGAPVQFIVTNTQNLSTIDLAGGEGCDASIATINMNVIPKNSTVTGDFTQVRVTRYRVSYRRTDGGTQVPNSFVRTVDALIAAGSSGSLVGFSIMEVDATVQAPFAALQPQNGGRDPETGRAIVKMDIIIEIFGETLGGDNVYDATSFPVEFCYACGGCD